MTPRALLTSIGVTAVGFAITIGVAAGSRDGVDTAQSNHIAAAAFAADDGVLGYPRSTGPTTESQRLFAWDDPCAIAV